jgi:hypothetical protein
MQTSASRTLALAALGLLAACGAGVDSPTPVEPKFASLYSNYLNRCANCHAVGAPGRTSDIETTLDFSTAAKAYASLGGSAAGLSGNQAACNGVAFVVSGHPEKSLLVAALDSSTRSAFSSGACDQDGVTDETVKQGGAPSAEWVAALKQWITSGAANN